MQSTGVGKAKQTTGLRQYARLPKYGNNSKRRYNMSTSTAGTHESGDFFPYTVMLQGTPDNLKHWVINPDGTKLKDYPTTALACEAAQFWFDWGLSFTSGELA